MFSSCYLEKFRGVNKRNLGEHIHIQCLSRFSIRTCDLRTYVRRNIQNKQPKPIQYLETHILIPYFSMKK
jgi:hypothetical protein